MRIITFVFALLLSISVISQSDCDKQEAVKIIDQNSFYLNGGANASMGGTSRIYLPITIPENTAEWYVSFTTAGTTTGTDNLNLLIQIGAIMGSFGSASSIMSEVKIPTGTGHINIYLLDKDNVNKFIDKDDYWGNGFSYKVECFRENATEGIICVKKILSGTYYLGIQNPSTMNGINVKIEAVAIVKDNENSQKADMYGDLGWKQFEKGDYEKCLQYTEQSLEICPSFWAYGNKGISLLMLGRVDEANAAYIESIFLIKKVSDAVTAARFYNLLIKDIDDILVSHPDLEGANDMKELLLSERKKLRTNG